MKICFTILLFSSIAGWACVFDTAGIQGGSETDDGGADTGDKAVCGNGILEDGEQCDGEDLGGATCETLGLGEGNLACTQSCTYDTSDCRVQSYCGNNNREGDEVCDGTDLDGKTCMDFDYDGGELGCLIDCSDFDLSGCTTDPYCGNGVRDHGEECDGEDLGGMTTCADFNCRSPGLVTCNPDCTFNLSACHSGYDEDGDGIDDNCDNCPSYYNPDQVDGNNDGIGDVCEAPWDHSLVSSIVVFDPMRSAQNSWMSREPGTWTYGGGVVVGQAISTAGNYIHEIVVPNLNYGVEATFSYDQPQTTGNNYTAVLFAWSDTYVAYGCAYDRMARNISIWRHNNFPGGWGHLSSVSVQTTATDSQWRKIHVFYDGNKIVCDYLDETGVRQSVEVIGSGVWADMSGRAGIRVYNERTVFSSFVIYR